MHVTHRIEGNICLLKLEGTLVVGNQDTVDQYIRTLPSTTMQTLILNLKKVSYMDSGAAGWLVHIFQHLTSQGQQLGLCECAPSVAKLLNLLSLDKHFSIYKTEQEAIEFYKKQP